MRLADGADGDLVATARLDTFGQIVVVERDLERVTRELCVDFFGCLTLIAVGGVEVTMLHTPGHTPGSTCFLCQDNLISGDTLFLTGCGRTDLPGGNADQLYDSLTNTIGKLPAKTMLYPGHHYDPAESATLDVVRKNNPYLKPGSLAEWKRLFGS